MTWKRFFGVIAFVGAWTLSLYAMGCGNSGGGTGGTVGTDGTGGTKGAGGSKGTGGSKGSGGAKGSGGTKGINPFEGGPDVGGPCPMDTTSFTPSTYAPSVAHQGKCLAADITAFVAACGDKSTATSCPTWAKANLAADGGAAGTACGNCIEAPSNNGPVWMDPNGYPQPNYAGCIQLVDTTNGGTCAPALDALFDCEGFACDPCTSSLTFSNCLTTVDAPGGGCESYSSMATTACKPDLADGGANSTCTPGNGKAIDPDWMYIVTLMCGS